MPEFKNKKNTIELNFWIFKYKAEIEITDDIKSAAWEMYVELATRITTAELKSNDGLLREALNSYYSLFNTTREILKKYGTSIATPLNPNDPTFGHLAVGVLNKFLRPLLSYWHPALQAWESRCNADVSPKDHEKAWPQEASLRADIEKVRLEMLEYTKVLEEITGVADLINATRQETK